MIFRVIVVSFALLTASCLPSDDELVDVVGYGNLEFGMDLVTAVGIAGTHNFNAYSLKICIEDMPLDGCWLTPNDDKTVFVSKEGIPYALNLKFTKFDELEQIGLQYRREKTVSQDQCVEIYKRSVDWLAIEYGVFRSSKGDAGTGVYKTLQSAGGNKIEAWFSDDNSVISDGDITLANGRQIWVLMVSRIMGGEAFCDVTINFSDKS